MGDTPTQGARHPKEDPLTKPMKTRAEIEAEIDRLEAEGPTVQNKGRTLVIYNRLKALQWVLGIESDI